MGNTKNCLNPAKFKNHKKLIARNILPSDLIALYNATNPQTRLKVNRVCINCYRWICSAVPQYVTTSTPSDADVQVPTAVAPACSAVSPQQSTSRGDVSHESTRKRSPSVMNVILPGRRISKDRFEATGNEFAKPTRRSALKRIEPSSIELQSEQMPSTSSFVEQNQEQPFVISKRRLSQRKSDDLSLVELPSLAPSPVNSNDSGSVFDNEDTRLQEANESLSAVGVSPITNRNIPKKSVRKKYVKAKLAIAEKLGLSTKTNLPLTPTSNCSWCKQLLAYLPKRFKTTSSKQEKYHILTTVPIQTPIVTVERVFKCSNFMAKAASKYKRKHGPFYSPLFATPDRRITENLVDAIINFYNSDDNSRVVAGERNSVLSRRRDGTRVRTQKRLILMSLRELYAEFIKSDEYTAFGYSDTEEASVGVSKFASLRPRHCCWPGPKGHHQTCLCIIHENFKLLCDVAGLTTSTDAFAMKYLCTEVSDNCFLGYCTECPNDERMRNDIRKYIGNDDVFYFLWKSTDRTDLVEVRETAEDFIQGFLEYVRKFTPHSLITRKQRDFISSLRAQIEIEKSVIVQVDFGMNYTFVAREEVQSAHFNPPQATVHPFVVNGIREGHDTITQKTFVVLSDDLNHNSNAFHVFRFHVIDLIKRDFPGVQHIHYVSDGSAAQYKNYKNLVNLHFHRSDFGITADWHFTSTAHGKSTCDAMTGVVKRKTRLHSMTLGAVVRNLDHMVLYCEGEWADRETIEIVDVRKEDICRRTPALEQRYAKACRLVGIQEKHSFVPVGHGVEVRRFSSSDTFEMFFPYGEPLMPAVFNKNVGDFVAFRVADSYQIGSIQEVDEENNFLTIICMARYKTINSFTWPALEKIEVVPILDVLGNVTEPTKTAPTGRVFRIPASEFKKLNALVRNVRAIERHEAE